MIIWLRRHTPTWLLRYLVWRNYRLRMAGRLPDQWYWADMELCIRQKQVCDKCGRLLVLLDFDHECNPVGVPEWLTDFDGSFLWTDDICEKMHPEDEVDWRLQ